MQYNFSEGPYLRYSKTYDDILAKLGSVIYFDYDSAYIIDEGRNTLNRISDFLKINKSLKIIITGHADERGTRNYQISIGDKRASATKSYLVSQGISENRIKTISYGREYLAVSGSNITSYALNRRAKIFVEHNLVAEQMQIAATNNLGPQIASTNNNPKVSSQELELERQKREQLEARLVALEAQQQNQQQAISADTQPPLLVAQSSAKDSSTATITGRVSDNTEVAEVTIDGQIVAINSDGSFSTDRFVPRGGKEVEIIAYDLNGNKASKRLFLIRDEVQEVKGPIFPSLNPSTRSAKSNPNAIALIIGVGEYERNHLAIYADKDARMFYDYAVRKLSIPAGNIKELVNNEAEEIDVRLAVKQWLIRSTKQNTTDVYVFFAGHGLASDDGEKMYLLPYDGAPELLDDTAILRNRLFNDIASANPRSVTVFPRHLLLRHDTWTRHADSIASYCY